MTMSDRIAVMNNGDIEQIGTPEEMYSRPKNVFVAQFIGNPSMNFLDGSYDSRGDIVTVSTNGNQFELDADLREEPTTEEVMIGIRPEAVKLLDGNRGDFSGELQLVERIGDRILATVDGPTQDGEVRATVSADHSLNEGETVGMELNRDRVYFFDANSGEAIGYDAIR